MLLERALKQHSESEQLLFNDNSTSYSYVVCTLELILLLSKGNISCRLCVDLELTEHR